MSRELGKRVRRASMAGGLLAGTAMAALFLCLAAPEHAAAQDRTASGSATKAGTADPELTGVPDAVFAHPGRFVCGATSREGAIRLAEAALAGAHDPGA